MFVCRCFSFRGFTSFWVFVFWVVFVCWFVSMGVFGCGLWVGLVTRFGVAGFGGDQCLYMDLSIDRFGRLGSRASS